MEILKEVISCAICKNRLKDPVFLPCGQTVCKWHTLEEVVKNKSFKCPACSQSHVIPPNGFTRNVAIANVLSKDIDRKIFISPYSEARENVDKLKQTLSECKQVSNDMRSFVHELFSNIKNRIDLNEAEIRLMLDEKLSSLRSRVEEYENECYNNLKKSTFDKFDDIQKDLDETNGYLNALHIDPGHWEWIRNRAREKRVEAENRLVVLKKKILLNKSIEFILENLDFRKMFDPIIESLDPFIDNHLKNKQNRLINKPVYLKSFSSGKYLCAEDWGKKAFVANRDTASGWEIFEFVEQEKGQVALKALVNGKYATFDDSKSSITAKSDNATDKHHKFEICLTFFDDYLIGIKSCVNQKYLFMPDDKNYPVCFWDKTLRRSSLFQVVKSYG